MIKGVSIIASTLLLLLLASHFTSAQNDTSTASVFKALPLAYYTPETRIAFEGFAFYGFTSKEARRKSNIRLFAAYTQNKQCIFILPWQIYTSKEKYFLSGSIDYQFFPEYFYGLGNYTLQNKRELYTYSALTFQNKTLKNLGNQTFVGFALNFQDLNTILPSNETLFISNQKIKGINGYKYIAAGPSIMYDTRDHILCPSKGIFFDFTGIFGVAQVKKSHVNFARIHFDSRSYAKLSSKITLAQQFFAVFSLGDVPYRVLPALGGPYLHRGYYLGRFRDKQLILYQTEYRQQLIGRLGMVAFLSAGRVFEKMEHAVLKHIRPAAGFGLRCKMSKADQTNIRVDYAITPDSQGLYIYFAEAF